MNSCLEIGTSTSAGWLARAFSVADSLLNFYGLEPEHPPDHFSMFLFFRHGATTCVGIVHFSWKAAQ